MRPVDIALKRPAAICPSDPFRRQEGTPWARRATAGLITWLVALAPGALQAEVTSFELRTTEPYGTFGVIDYVRIEGRVSGSLDTCEPIPGLAEADRDGDGQVEYATDLVLIVPADPREGNGTLLVDLPNRGRPVAHTLYNSSLTALVAPGSLEAGNGFLQEQGFLLAIPGWELGHGLELPHYVAEGETRYEGAGFAAVRDIAAWLKGINDAATDPLGGAVERALAVGYSQSARFLKSFLRHGFNGLGEARVLDGMHLQGAHAGLLPLLEGSAGAESAASVIPTFARPDLPGVHEPPFTYGEILAEAARFGPDLPRLVATTWPTTTTPSAPRSPERGRWGPRMSRCRRPGGARGPTRGPPCEHPGARGRRGRQ